ncbi:MAG: DUF1566 domain-containing protein [Burkholderiales bacterium]
MKNLWTCVSGVCVVMSLGLSSTAQAASAVGPYYAMPAWDQTLPAATRFIVLTNMASQAVLDRETGLVWEQSPGTTGRTWQDAQEHCMDKTVGDRDGWRLPTVQEQKSLVDRNQRNPSLPAAHPFIGVQPSSYWSATSYALNSNSAWTVSFFAGGAFIVPKSLNSVPVWCVRGGQGVNPQ